MQDKPPNKYTTKSALKVLLCLNLMLMLPLSCGGVTAMVGAE